MNGFPLRLRTGQLSILIISTQHTGDSSWVNLKKGKTPKRLEREHLYSHMT